MPRIVQHKYTASDGAVYDSVDEYRYHQILLASPDVSCIHRQVRLLIIPKVEMIVPKQLKTKIRYDKRQLVSPHHYKPDFIFFERGRIVICDVKSSYTATMREFNITAKACIQKIIRHNRQRHGGEPVVIFRKAIAMPRHQWRIIDYPPAGCKII